MAHQNFIGSKFRSYPWADTTRSAIGSHLLVSMADGLIPGKDRAFGMHHGMEQGGAFVALGWNVWSWICHVYDPLGLGEEQGCYSALMEACVLFFLTRGLESVRPLHQGCS